jgi:hypothetical protein
LPLPQSRKITEYLEKSKSGERQGERGREMFKKGRERDREREDE